MTFSSLKKYISYILVICMVYIVSSYTLDARVAGDRNNNTNTGEPKKQQSNSTKKKRDHFLSEKYTGKKLEKAKKSLKGDGEYRLLIESTGGIEKVRSDLTANLSQLPKIKQVGENLYMIRLSSQRADLREEFSKMDNGVVPAQFAGYPVVEPEVFEAFDSPLYLTGESTSQLWWMNRIGSPSATLTGEKTKVAILDTGIDFTHPDLSENYDHTLSYDFLANASGGVDDNGHGTQVAGVLGASVNGTGTFGVNPHVDIISLKVLDANGFGTTYDVLEALTYVTGKGVPVVNMSFGGLVGDPASNPICRAITELRYNGTITVVAAGNTNQSVTNTIPAACPDAITVGATDHDGSRASFSNYGNFVDIYAPGVDIYTTNISQSYITKNGTSFSAPIVSGIVTRMLSGDPNMGYDSIVSTLQSYSGLTLSPENILSSSGGVMSGSTATGQTGSIPPIDYTTYKYYSGTFQYNGSIYGNSLYSDSRDFSGADLSHVQIYPYTEYQSLIQSGSQVFQTLSVPTNGLIGEWKLDGNALDTSGNGNNGTATNVNWLTESGRLVASFNGANSDINIPNNTFLNGKQQLTVSTWINWGDHSTTQLRGILGNQGHYVGDLHYQYMSSDGNNQTIVFYVAGASDSYIMKDLGPITLNQWYLLVTTYDLTTNTIKYYLNGELKGSQTFGYLPPINIYTQLNIASVYNSARFHLGGLSRLSIHDRVLSTAEIQSLYQSGLSTVDDNTAYNLPDLKYSALYTNPLLSYSNLEQSSRVYQTNSQLSGNSATQQTKSNTEGDPVHLATGEFTYENTLMQLPGARAPYTFDVYYTNQNYYNGPLGINWDHNYNLYLSEESNGNVLFYNGKLGVYRFIKNGSNYDYNVGLGATLSYSGGLYTITYDSGKAYRFNTAKKISKISDPFGDLFVFTYSGDLLSQVTDSLGRNYAYTYTNNRLIQVTDPYGHTVGINYYDGSNASGSLYDLRDITINNGTGSTKTVSFTYSTGGDTVSDHNIVDLIDAKGQVYVHNTYENDRVKTQKYGTGTITYTYTLSGNSVIGNTVIDRLGNQTTYTYDAYGNNTELRQYTATGTQSYIYTYNMSGQLVSEKRPRGNGYTYLYNAGGKVVEKRMKADMNQANGSGDLVTTFAYDSVGNITEMIEPIGKITNFTYTGTSLLARRDIVYGTGTITDTYSYDALGRLIDHRDALGNPTLYTYTGATTLPSQIRTGTGTEQITVAYTYDALGNPITVTDGSGSTTTYTYDAFSRRISETSPEGVTQTYVYDANNNQTQSSLSLSPSVSLDTSTTYDALDLPLSITREISEGVSVSTTKSYNANGDIIAILSPNGLRETRTYNSLGKLATVTQSGSQLSTTSYVYDTNGNLISENKNGHITSYDYDLYDRLIRTTDALGTYTTVTYDKAGNILTNKVYTSTGLLMRETGYIYDILSRLTQMSEKKLEDNTYSNTSYTYDKNGNKLTEKNALNYTTTYTYDSLGRQRTKTLPNGLQYENIYDKANNLITEKSISASGTITTTHTYDRDNRRIMTTNTLGKSTAVLYNHLGQILSSTDEQGRITTYTRDYRGLPLTETHYQSGQSITTTKSYDTQGNMTSITDPEGHTTTYQYDTLSHTTQITYPDSTSVILTYDTNGNLSTRTDPNSTTVTNTYDPLNRLISRSISTGSGVAGVTSETYTYDALGRLIATNNSENHQTNFVYDSLGRLTSESQTASGQTKTIGYTYDNNNNILILTHPDGQIQTFTYDVLDRNTTVGYSGQTIAQYTYSDNLLDTLTFANNRTTHYTYDSLNRLTTINTGTGITPYTYTYDDSSLIMSDGTKNYGYDNLKRLLSATPTNTGSINQNIESYSYDKTGNRTTDAQNTITTNYTTNTLDQYTSQTGGVNKNYTYDNNGNLKSDGTKIYIYDYQNHLVEVTQSGTTLVRYQYDVLGRRIQKSASTETIIYIYSGDNIIQELRTIGGLTLKKEYINGLGTDNLIAYDVEESANQDKIAFCQMRVLPYSSEFQSYGYQSIIDDCNSTISSSTGVTTNRYYYHTNHLGSVIGISDNSGNIVQQYTYDSFGKAYTVTGTGILTSIDSVSNLYGNTRLFTGREYDREVSLYFNRARYYDPQTGRFISRDPIGQNDQINLYMYVKNNPLNFTDRFGLEGKPVLVVSILGKESSNDGGEIVDYSNRNGGLIEVLKKLNQVDSTKYTTKAYKSDHYGNTIGQATEFIVSQQGKYDKLVILGHSLGGDNAVNIASELDNRNIDVTLLITLDIKSIYENDTIYPNVRKAVNYYQNNDEFPRNGEDLENSLFNKTTDLQNILMNEFNGEKLYHTTIDDALTETIYKTIYNQ